MTLFIKKIIAIVLAVILIVGGCEIIIRNSLNAYSYKNQYVQNNGAQIETIALGTSHAYAGIDPSCFKSNTFNLANSAQPLKVDYYTLLRYGSYLANLKCVILDLTDFSFRTGGYDTPGNEYNYINYNVFMEYKGADFTVENSFIFLHTPLFGNFLKDVILGENMRCDSLGQGSYYNIKNKKVNTNENGVSEAKQHAFRRSNFIEKNTNFFIDIAQYCKSRDIRLVVISTPIWHTYYENIYPEQYDEMQSIIKETKKIYGFEYYNFMNDRRFVEDDFMDSHHLSNIGAEKFSRILADSLDL